MNLGPFRIGDNPANPIQIELDADNDLTAYATASATLFGPGRGVVATLPAVEIESETLTFQFPASPFNAAGVYSLAVKLHGEGGVLLSLADLPIVVESEDGWHTLATARSEWADAPYDDGQLFRLLAIAEEQVSAYAPAFTGRPSLSLRAAQLMQARNTWNAVKVSSDGGLGPEGYIITPRPLDWMVKQLLRPKRGPLAVIG